MDGALCDKFKRLYALESIPARTVADGLVWAASSFSWVWSWRRSPSGRSAGEFEELCHLLRSFIPTSVKPDL